MTNPLRILRARREDAEARVLTAIRNGADHGFGICEATRLSPGRAYPALERLERRGANTSCWEPDPGDAGVVTLPAARGYEARLQPYVKARAALARLAGREG